MPSTSYHHVVNIRKEVELFPLAAILGNRGISIQVIIAIVVPIVVVSLVVLLVGLHFLTGRTKKKKKKKQCGTIKERNEEDDISTVEALQYEFNTIDLATTSFSADNKIGAGGFGDVYKSSLLLAVAATSSSTRREASLRLVMLEMVGG
ncbi:unnamed protein product [Fraxinus pennsylvanica]|uniref:Uncharacterized protein n=1 Tax=Fraxinus pennsylvanica TaxID=56036 RepID=A0AAD1Z0J2_9LAMI|nr:unnamed protein product [Fraxinus pennsylvanica]